jgi:hypothetical protein
MLSQERQFIPVSPLKFYFPVGYVEKTAASESERIFPFQHAPLAILENVFNDADHFGPGKFPFKYEQGTITIRRII